MKVGFVGSGNMAEAMIAALIEAKLAAPHEIFASDISSERRAALKQRFRINMYSKNQVIPGMAEIVFMAVKPQQMSEVLKEIASGVGRQHLVISIAAGKTLSFIQSILPQARVIRVMPNLPCTVLEGMSVFCLGSKANAADRHTATRLLSCFGKVLELPEDQFNAVTALSGSGPAFFSYFLNAMLDAGAKEGLAAKDALLLAEQTMLGTSKLLIEKNMDPADLIKAVTSAKGTTAAGLEVLDKSDVLSIVRQTIKAAARRSAELSG
jgi:pyrroline-5-carboxylate reductase